MGTGHGSCYSYPVDFVTYQAAWSPCFPGPVIDFYNGKNRVFFIITSLVSFLLVTSPVMRTFLKYALTLFQLLCLKVF